MGERSLLTFDKDFRDMYSRLMAQGAGRRALEGQIASPDGRREAAAIRAIFHITVNPPTITQIIPSGHGNMTATFTRLHRPVDEKPVVAAGRCTYDLPAEASAIYAFVADPSNTPAGMLSGAAAAATFDSVYENATLFTAEPDAI
jgi:hypothetical protein